ncbi:hypothetical protein [Francisella marina]|nr:hypothetical protein [Francisella marina]
MSDFVIREKDYDKLVANIETIATFCTEQKAINSDFENFKKALKE